MDKIYFQGKDEAIANFVVYGKAADHKLYAESAFTNQIKEEELQEMAKKGLLLIDDDGVLKLAVAVDDEKAYTVEAKTITISEASVAVSELVAWSAAAAA